MCIYDEWIAVIFTVGYKQLELNQPNRFLLASASQFSRKTYDKC